MVTAKWHNVKAGTPTMGGFVFLISAMITAIWVGAWQNQLTASLFILLFITLVYGALGFLDDFIKIFRKRNMGLNSLQKLIGQILGGLVFTLFFERKQCRRVKFLWDRCATVDLFTECSSSFGWSVFKCSQLDRRYRWSGRRTGHDFFSTYALIAWRQDQIDVLIVCLAIIGGLIGFFPYNRKPAKIFMGMSARWL